MNTTDEKDLEDAFATAQKLLDGCSPDEGWDTCVDKWNEAVDSLRELLESGQPQSVERAQNLLATHGRKWALHATKLLAESEPDEEHLEVAAALVGVLRDARDRHLSKRSDLRAPLAILDRLSERLTQEIKARSGRPVTRTRPKGKRGGRPRIRSKQL
jgi:hypothetical protein